MPPCCAASPWRCRRRRRWCISTAQPFRARVIFAVLAPDGLTATLKFTPEEQEFRCSIAPAAFAPTGDAWGKQGWTRATLAALSEEELAAALEAAWKTAQAKPPKKPRKRA